MFIPSLCFYLIFSICNLTVWSDQCFQTGQCRDSSTVGISTTTDEFACLDLCKKSIECKWLTFSTLTNRCLLLKDCQVLDEEICPECLSGQHFCIPDDPVCNIQGTALEFWITLRNFPLWKPVFSFVNLHLDVAGSPLSKPLWSVFCSKPVQN